MNSLQSLYEQAVFLVSSLTLWGFIDLFLVTGAFFLILSLIRRSSAAYLLREVLAVGVGLFVLTAILPLPVFDWLVRAILVGMLVATPIVFQAQLRQFLSRISRAAGIAQAARQSVAEEVIPEIVHATENMAASRTGALLVLENNDSLADVAQSGIASGAKITSEMLQSIFYNGTPLHDGAVIVRTDKVLAAGCVLPLTEQTLHAEKRLGTRHRAAVGMSEVSDALVIVVSEETGHIGVAQGGELHRPVTNAELRDRLQDFYDPALEKSSSISMWQILKKLFDQFWSSSALNNPQQWVSNLGLLFISLLLTLLVWTFVMQQTNAIERARVEGIPLRVEGLPSDFTFIPSPPASVSAIIQTTGETLPTLSPRSFQATVSVEELQPGLRRLPVRVTASVDQVRIISTDPVALDLELAPIISKTLPVAVFVPDMENLSPAYEVVGAPVASPGQVRVQGPAPLVEQVSQVQVTLSLANANTSLRETRPVRAVNEQGQEVSGVTLQPDQVRVIVTIRQRLNASDVSIQPAITGTPPRGYQLRQVTVSPSNVTLQGSSDQLAQMGSVVSTRPVDVSQVTGSVTLQTPLDLPPNIQAVDSAGNSARTVSVTVQVTPVEGNITMSRPIELINVPSTITETTVTPEQVRLLLSGPVPVLDDIQENPDLVQVLADAAGLSPGQSATITPQVVGPSNVQFQAVPPTIQISPE